MLSEISQKEKDKYCNISLIHRILKKQQKSPPPKLNLEIQRTDWWLPEVGAWGVGEMGEGGQETHTSSYIISKSRGGNVQRGDNS